MKYSFYYLFIVFRTPASEAQLNYEPPDFMTDLFEKVLAQKITQVILVLLVQKQ
jgi:hypothetical protein